MLRRAVTGLLLLAACSSPATSAGREATQREPATTTAADGSDEHRDAPLMYRLTPGTTSTCVMIETVADVTTLDGTAFPEESVHGSARVTATVLQPRDGTYVIEYRLDDLRIDSDPPEQDPQMRAALDAYLAEQKGRTHARTVNTRGESRPLTRSTAELDSMVVSVIEHMQLPGLPSGTLSLETTWPDCIADYTPEGSKRESDTICKVLAMDDGRIQIEVTTTPGQSDTEPPTIRDIPEESIVVTTSETENRCIYRVALDDPLPISIDCDELRRKSGTAAGKPFTYEWTRHATVAIPADADD